jgi:hypothetical protein
MSTRVSSGLTLFKHSSPSFRSQQPCSYSNPSEDIRIGRWCTLAGSHLRSLSLRARALHLNTRIDARLFAPCFKTGRLQPLRQHPSRCHIIPISKLYIVSLQEERPDNTRSWRTSYLQSALKTVDSIPKHTSITTLEPAKPKQPLTRERHIFSRRTSHQEL